MKGCHDFDVFWWMGFVEAVEMEGCERDVPVPIIMIKSISVEVESN